MVIAFYYAYIHQAGSSGIVSFAIAAVPGWRLFAFSDIDSVRPNLPGNWLLHQIMRISVDSRALELSPSPSLPFLAATLRLLRYRPSHCVFIWRSVIATYHAYIHQAETFGIASFAVNAISGRHPPPSQISTQPLQIYLEIGRCTLLCIYPLSWDCLLRCCCCFWPPSICLLRSRPSDCKCTWRLVTATYDVYIRRYGS